MDVDEDEVPEHHTDGRVRLFSQHSRRTLAWCPSLRPGSAARASTYHVVLYVYYPIALYVYYLIALHDFYLNCVARFLSYCVGVGTQSRSLGSAAPHLAANG
jgi:hypothetical protein